MEGMIRSIRIAFRDWLRGYTDDDIRSLQLRFQGLEKWATDATIWLTKEETRVLQAGHIIGVWRISTLSVRNGRALVKLRDGFAAGV